MLELKGPLFHSTLSYIKKKAGEERYKTFVAQLEPDLQAFLAKPILASKFYPVDLLKRITQSFVTWDGRDAEATYRDIGATSAEKTRW